MVMSAAALRMAEQSAMHLERAIHSQKAGFDRNVVYSQSGVTINFRAGFGDTFSEDKIAAMRSAIAKVDGLGLRLPNTIKVYTSSDQGFVNVSFQRARGGHREASIGLGGKLAQPSSLPVGKATLHGTGPVRRYITAVCVHELGHILHELASEEFFWSTAANAITPGSLGTQAGSMYAAANIREFVAEVFAGLVYGESFSREVMEAYRNYHGPVVPGGFGTTP
jgi:hypothetical protein